MKIGATYHPEIYHPSEWQQDLSTGSDIGLSVLRCGELAWNSYNPATGSLEADWVPMFLDVADTTGYELIWCTPSGGPPPFAFEKWPDLAGDLGRQPGSFCLSHPGYRELRTQVATLLQQMLGNTLSVVGWDVDNGMNAGVCTCARCEAAFHEWLEERYETIDNLNAAWQTRALGQVFTNWRQVPIPRAGSGAWPLSLRLAFHRFRASLAQLYYEAQHTALERAGAMVVGTSVCCTASGETFDRSAWSDTQDAYGTIQPFDGSVDTEFELAVARGSMVGAKPLWVLEWLTVNRSGQSPTTSDADVVAEHLRRCAQAGAQYVLFRPLRQFSAGLEIEHRAIIGHDGKPTRAAEVIRSAIRSAHGVEAAFAEIDALLLFSYEQEWATRIRAQESAPFDYHAHVHANWFHGLVDVYGAVRIGGPSDISGFEEVIVAPFQQLREPNLLEALKRALTSGCTLITTFDFGRFDADNNILPEPLLNILTLWGAHVPDMEMLWLPQAVELKGRLNGIEVRGTNFVAQPRYEAPKNARYEEIGRLENSNYSGCAALRTRVGDGQIFVAMTAFDRAGVNALVTLARAEL